ncbi:hypothetical protein D915_007577 [Fasciola hepatica]|uniref:Uncharacterized protein n=1 Tax=Fasciola hepatica TaxID=6192 RepID=A0A4E0R4V6_FASHE|nr:hypothetical protein D915_007577 [Fasciola hepatica]
MSCFGIGRSKAGEEYVRSKSQWNTYTCGCCENCGNCCCCLFCCPCVMADLYHYTCSLPWWTALLLGILLLPFHMFLVMVVRARVRWKHNLEGNTVSDVCCLVCCCWPLVVCQLRDQIHHLRREQQWKLGYAQEFGDIPPWIKPCLRLRDLAKRRKKKNTKAMDDASTEDDGDELSENQKDEKTDRESKKKDAGEDGDSSDNDDDDDDDEEDTDNDEESSDSDD